MKFKDSETFSTRVCEICGGHVGMGYDHSECSKVKKEKYAGANERKNPKKRLYKSNIDYFCKTYT